MRRTIEVLLALSALLACGPTPEQRRIDSARLASDSIAAARHRSVAAIGSQFNASREWIAALDSVDSYLERPFTIALQDVFQSAARSRHLFVGHLSDMWRDTSGVVIQFFDDELYSVKFNLSCSPAEQSVRERKREMLLGGRLGPSYVVVAESLRVVRSDRPATNVSASNGEASTEIDIEGTPVIHGRCVTIQRLRE